MGKFPKKFEGWQCKICDGTYDTQEEVEACCFEEKQEEVILWECVDCGERYEEREEAYSCCE